MIEDDKSQKDTHKNKNFDEFKVFEGKIKTLLSEEREVNI